MIYSICDCCHWHCCQNEQNNREIQHGANEHQVMVCLCVRHAHCQPRVFTLFHIEITYISRSHTLIQIIDLHIVQSYLYGKSTKYSSFAINILHWFPCQYYIIVSYFDAKNKFSLFCTWEVSIVCSREKCTWFNGHTSAYTCSVDVDSCFLS